MDALQKARETQLRNIETKTGKNLEVIRTLIQSSGLTKHGEIRTFLMQELGLGHGDANSLVHYALATDGQTAAEEKGLSNDDVLDEIYSAKKAGLRAAKMGGFFIEKTFLESRERQKTKK